MVNRSQYPFAMWAGPGKIVPTRLQAGDTIFLDVSDGRVFGGPSMLISNVFLCRGLDLLYLATDEGGRRPNLQIPGAINRESFRALAETFAAAGSLQLQPFDRTDALPPDYRLPEPPAWLSETAQHIYGYKRIQIEHPSAPSFSELDGRHIGFKFVAQ